MRRLSRKIRVGTVGVIYGTSDRHRGRRGWRGRMVATFVVDRRWGPSTDVDVEILVLVVVATHVCEGEGYDALLATR